MSVRLFLHLELSDSSAPSLFLPAVRGHGAVIVVLNINIISLVTTILFGGSL